MDRAVIVVKLQRWLPLPDGDVVDITTMSK